MDGFWPTDKHAVTNLGTVSTALANEKCSTKLTDGFYN